jgi:malate synthase
MVVHPAMVNAAMIEFNKHMALRNQFNYLRNDGITPADLLRRPDGPITVEGLKELMRPTLLALARAPGDRGWVAHDGRLYDRSALRLALRLLWQWNHATRGLITATGLPINEDLLRFMLRKEAVKLPTHADERARRRTDAAIERMLELVVAPQPPLEPMA